MLRENGIWAKDNFYRVYSPLNSVGEERVKKKEDRITEIFTKRPFHCGLKMVRKLGAFYIRRYVLEQKFLKTAKIHNDKKTK